MQYTRLNGPALDAALSELDGWTVAADHGHIARSWTFDSFATAMAFWAKVAMLADQQDHHPECLSLYTHIRIRLWTHDAGGLTHKDMTLAKAIDALLTGEFSNKLKS
jgi:4a-hydroxytetrahydrobiopterin dehydratase